MVFTQSKLVIKSLKKKNDVGYYELLEKDLMSVNDKSLIVPKDHILNSPIRLTIMMLLYVHKRISFGDLQKLLHLTPGNLDHHIRKMEEMNYLERKRLIFPKRISVYVIKTSEGENKLLDYIAGLQDVLSQFNSKL